MRFTLGKARRAMAALNADPGNTTQAIPAIAVGASQAFEPPPTYAPLRSVGAPVPVG